MSPTRQHAGASTGSRAAGFTLIELVVVLGILVGFLAMLVQFVDSGVRLFDEGEAGQALADRAEVARIAVERELRAITADGRRIEPGVPKDRFLLQLLPLGLPAKAQPADPRAFVLRAGVSLAPIDEQRLLEDELLVRAAVELGAGADPAALRARALELRQASGLRGRGRILLAQWPQSDDGALVELRIGRFLEDQTLPIGDRAVDPFTVPVPGAGELPTLALYAHTDLLVGGLLYAEILMWSQTTKDWQQNGANGPETVWDSARAGWLADPSTGPVFRLDRSIESMADPTDDVHPRALRVTLVVAGDETRPLDGLLVDTIEADSRTAVLINGERFPGAVDGGWAKIEGEWVRYAGRVGNELRGLLRGQRGTRAQSHRDGAALRVGRTVQFTIRCAHGKDDWNG